MCARSKVTSKGQVTIPKEVRDRLGLRMGDEIEWKTDRSILQVRKVRRRSKLDKWVGYLKDLKGQGPDELVREMRGH
ncbi:MAG: AbrB/MazE/SpoVT family DNA-binding domain-containing protein [Chloroflexota bacterium]|nr:AbrB/MazE/SpoVT family DNA-binding domain-containing protein [Chloroflexota bacterium]